MSAPSPSTAAGSTSVPTETPTTTMMSGGSGENCGGVSVTMTVMVKRSETVSPSESRAV